MSAEPLLRIEGVSKAFPWGKTRIQAVNRAHLSIARGTTVGVVGESGSGKSTLGRLAIGLLSPDEGAVFLEGTPLPLKDGRAMRRHRRDLQIVFQNPASALNPRVPTARNIAEPLVVHNVGTARERSRRVAELLTRVGLDPAYSTALPDELSGGQLQRVMIARALALGPKLVVCDEVLSALDLSVQAQVLKLLRALQQDSNLSYLFISHNLAAVGYFSDVIAVMYLGEIVEIGPATDILAAPSHPYTVGLFRSILHVPPSKAGRMPPEPLPGEIPSPLHRPPGCPFHPRCAWATEACQTAPPALRVVSGTHQAACHHLERIEGGGVPVR